MNGYVLAGGASRRMGRDKALIEVDGVPLARRMAEVLREGGCQEVFVVGNNEALSSLGVPAIADVEGARHPLRGLSAAMLHCTEALLLCAPCDLVHLEPADARRLLKHAGPCVATDGVRLQPLLAVYPTRWHPRVQARMLSNGSVTGLAEELDPVPLPARALVNVNHPADLEALVGRQTPR